MQFVCSGLFQSIVRLHRLRRLLTWLCDRLHRSRKLHGAVLGGGRRAALCAQGRRNHRVARPPCLPNSGTSTASRSTCTLCRDPQKRRPALTIQTNADSCTHSSFSSQNPHPALSRCTPSPVAAVKHDEARWRRSRESEAVGGTSDSRPPVIPNPRDAVFV